MKEHLKRSEKTIDAELWSVSRRGTDGICLKIAYTTKGPKHTTTYVRNINLSLCAMRRMGSQFHVIMNELGNEWHNTKKAISGE